MTKEDIAYMTYAPEMLRALEAPGLLLVTQGKDGKPNPMTIGWATLGCLWGLPCFVTLVRPSRYSYKLLEENREFTINVLPKELAEAASYCGTVSGRDDDKFATQGFIALPSRKVKPPVIEQCVIHLECRVVHYNDIIAETMPAELAKSTYPAGDVHRFYYGEILAAYADLDARQRL
jgi:flavin reductase (DIM6/NTAB) family NADH-FMN oxidoreductase RutF